MLQSERKIPGHELLGDMRLRAIAEFMDWYENRRGNKAQCELDANWRAFLTSEYRYRWARLGEAKQSKPTGGGKRNGR